jgi:hypothetical protein
MTFKDLAKKRRSIRTFTEQSVTEEQRKQLIEMYVSNFGLPVKSYQDEGSEKIMLENLS